MPYYDKDSLELKGLPQRSRVVIIGGGIHGVGIAHDLASRSCTDTLLLEQNTLGSGTSSWSTKLIHGGLRYLQNPSQFSLVKEALFERKLLCELAPDIVRSLPLIYPIRKKGGRSAFTVKSGLWLYDRLAGDQNLHPHSSLSIQELSEELPEFNTELFSKGFTFWDGQTDDQKLVMRVASSAVKLGATLAEGVFVDKILACEQGWSLELRNHKGQKHTLSALYVIVATGPWSHELFTRSNMTPKVKALNNRGSHLLAADLGLKKGLFLESQQKDSRIFFALPWQGKTLIGTTEVLHEGKVADQQPSEQEVQYLLDNFNSYRKEPLKLQDIEYVFSGLRWLPERNSESSLSGISRGSMFTSHSSSGGAKLWTLYGGKLTSYRLLAQKLVDEVLKEFGTYCESETHLAHKWAQKGEDLKEAPSLDQRFIARP